MIRYKIQNVSGVISGVMSTVITIVGINYVEGYGLIVGWIVLVFMIMHIGIPVYTFYKKQLGFKYIANDSLFARVSEGIFIIGASIYIFL